MTSSEPFPDRPADSGERFFGRRRGRSLKTGARGLVETLLPRLAVPVPRTGERVDPRLWFGPATRALWLEVGFGGGEHLAWQAERHPDIGLIGGEVFLNGIASLLGHVARRELGNVRIFAEDLRRLLPCLPESCLERVFVLFPDPWPKKRHEERRFINPANLDQLARLLGDGGTLRIASDDETYKGWMIDQMERRTDFERILAQTGNKPDDWPATRYEMKAVAAGRLPLFAEYRRRARAIKTAALQPFDVV